MATVLLTYEFGAGLGHLNRLIAVAKRLGPGHRLVFAVPEPNRQGPLLRRALGAAIEVQQGASWPPPSDPRAREVPTLTFADVARLFGFGRVDALTEAVRRALALLREISPRLIVADFAPTMRLASSGRVPTIVAGNGYTVPPRGRPLPLMRPWGKEMHPKSRAHEAMLLAAANEISARFSGPAIDFFADLFQGEESFVCTLAEFDPYRESRASPVLWPFNIPKMPPARAFSERRGPAVFCYLQAGHPALQPVLEALGGLETRSEIYIDGIDPCRLAQRCTPRIGIHRAPADFAAVLPEASLILHHAGLGTAYAGLAAGVPQLVLPLNLEHLITARGLEAFGTTVPLSTTPPPSRDRLRPLIQQVLGDAHRREIAVHAAEELGRRRDNDSLDRIVGACTSRL